jgi:2-hydroxychromene-2-carboxylate isomerase
MRPLLGLPAMIEFFFDISSPWTYLAFHRVQQIAQECDQQLIWRPILVGGVFNAVNPTVYASREQPVLAKQRYLHKDLQDWAKHTGLQIVFPPSVFPVNSVKAMRACIVLEASGQLPAFARAAFEAYWAQNQDISQADVLRAIFVHLGLDANVVMERLQEDSVKEQLRANTQELIDRGGFGSPTYFLDHKDMYFGNDRLDLLRSAILKLQH